MQQKNIHFLETCQKSTVNIPRVTALCQVHGVGSCLRRGGSWGTSQGIFMIKLAGGVFSVLTESSMTFLQLFNSHQNIPANKLVYLDICGRWIITKESQTQLKQAATWSSFWQIILEKRHWFTATDIQNPMEKSGLLRYTCLIFLAMLGNRGVII